MVGLSLKHTKVVFSMENKTLIDKELSNVSGGFAPGINAHIGQFHEDKKITKAHVGETAFQLQYMKEIVHDVVHGPVGLMPEGLHY